MGTHAANAETPAARAGVSVRKRAFSMARRLSPERLVFPMQENTRCTRPDAQAPSNGHHPRNPHGSHFALIAERLAVLPGGEGIVMGWLIAARRTGSEGLYYTVRELGRCTGWDSRTLAAHVASLREKGLIHPDLLRADPSAFTKPGERHARVDVRSLMAQPTAAEYRAHVAERLYTDARGRLRVSRESVADLLGVTRRAVRKAVAGCRRRGIACAVAVYRRPAKTFRSTRQKGSGPPAKPFRQSVEGVGKEIIKEVLTRFSGKADRPNRPSGPSAADFEAKRAEQKAALERLMREATA